MPADAVTEAVMNRALILRRVALAGSGLTFGAIAILSTAAPHAVARVYGLTLDGTDGLNEFRAIFVGFWLSLCVAMLAAARRDASPSLGHACGLMVLLQALGRVCSLAQDGRPSWPFLAALSAELLTAACILGPWIVRRPMRSPAGARR